MNIPELENEITKLEARKDELTAQLNQDAGLLGKKEAAWVAALLGGNDPGNEKTIEALKRTQVARRSAIALADEQLRPLHDKLGKLKAAAELEEIRTKLNGRIRLLVGEYRHSMSEIQVGLDRVRGMKEEFNEISPLSKRTDLIEYREIVNSLWACVVAWLQQEDLYTQTKIRRCSERLEILSAQIDAVNPIEKAVSTVGAQGDRAHK